MDDDDRRLSALMANAVAGLDADPDRLVAVASGQGVRRVRRRTAIRVGGLGLVAAAVVTAVAVTQLRPAPDASRVATATPSPTVTASGPVPFVRQDGDPLVVCGQDVHRWSPATTAGWPGADREEFVPALEAWLARPDVHGMAPKGLTATASVRDAAWRGVFLDRTSDGWKVSSTSEPLTCEPQPLLASEKTFWLPVGVLGDVSRSSTEVDVGVGDPQCRLKDPAPYLREPYVVETAESVLVYLTVPRGYRDGYMSCEMNIDGSSTQWPWTLHLRAPLGDRALLDGSVYPPKVVVPAR